jgi:hypothetical protein
MKNKLLKKLVKCSLQDLGNSKDLLNPLESSSNCMKALESFMTALKDT